MNITFTITFHGPFHVGSGIPGQGLDRVLDRDALLPATSLKGVMRAAAAEILGLPSVVVGEVFGEGQPDKGAPRPTRSQASPWVWSDASLGQAAIQSTSRIRIDDETGLVDRGFLMLGETVLATTGSYTVTRFGPTRMDVVDHVLVLRASARAVTSVGGGRTRGEGWVTIEDDKPWTMDDTRALRQVGGAR